MTRLSGIQLLALSVVLWALAVWVFSAPQPADTDSTAATGTTTPATGEAAAESGTDTADAAVAEAVSAPSAETDEGVAVASSPDTRAEDSPLQEVPERTGAETAAAHSTAGATATPPAEVRTPPGTGWTNYPPRVGVPATPTAEIRTPPAAIGDGSRIALAPESTHRDPAAGSARGSPTFPGDSATERPRGSVGRPGPPPDPARPHPWLEHPLSRPPPPPARPDHSAPGGDAVARQLDAARRAAWEGRFADALSHYRAAARLRPNDYVVWGEMGNVLWTMRRWPEAAYALEGAATLLVRAGELRAASELVPAVGRIDPDAAYRVQRLLWAAAQRQSG